MRSARESNAVRFRPDVRITTVLLKEPVHAFVRPAQAAAVVNGLTGSRRVARPVRLALATTLGGDIDGAWWPHTASEAQELPELIGSLHKPLGEIIEICINWPATEGPIDLESIVAGARSLVLSKKRPPRIMVVDGRGACAKLLVLPHMTSPALGALVMRCAAAMPIDGPERAGPLFETAELVIQTAQVESAKWAARLRA
jgi:Family of unknown function (DUF5994)